MPFLRNSEEYESELEHMNTAMTAENHTLQYDNKQLNALIKEHEQTLETVMSSFRNRAVYILPGHLFLAVAYDLYI